jgi:Cu+-exporting ATPase
MIKEYLKTLSYKSLIMGIVLAMLIIAINHADNFSFLPAEILKILSRNYLQSILFLPILFWVSRHIWQSTWKNLIKKHLPGDLLFLLALIIGSTVSYLVVLNPNILINLGYEPKTYFGTLSVIIIIKVLLNCYLDYWQDKTFLKRNITNLESLIRKRSWLFTGLICFLSLGISWLWLNLTNMDFSLVLEILLSSLLIIPTNILLIALRGIISQLIKNLNNSGVNVVNQKNLLEMANLKRVVFDRMSLLMSQDFEITDLVAAKPNQLLKFSASLEAGIDHSIGRSLIQRSDRENINLCEVQNRQSYPGMGVTGFINGKKMVLGNMALMRQENIVVGVLQREKTRLEKMGKKVIILGISQHNNLSKQIPGEVIGLIALTAKVKNDAKEFIKFLQDKNIETWILTGESQQSAEVSAQTLNISSDYVLAGVLPSQKGAVIRELFNTDPTKQLAVIGNDILPKKSLFNNVSFGIYLGDTLIEDNGIDIWIKDGKLLSIENLLISVQKGSQKIKQNNMGEIIYMILLLPICFGLLNFKPISFIVHPIIAIAVCAVAIMVILNNSTLNKFNKEENGT